MDKFLGRLTFGFLIGQVAPGFLIVTSLWFIYKPDIGFLHLQLAPGAVPWFTLLAVGSFVGMALDQLNWVGTGWYSSFLKKHPSIKKIDFFVVFWIVLGPLGVVLPVLIGLTFAKVSDLKANEFLPAIDPDRFNQWQWLQDFYLYRSEFFINTSLAAALLFIPLSMEGISFWYGVTLWATVGVFNLLSIRMTETLEGAEEELVNATKTS